MMPQTAWKTRRAKVGPQQFYKIVDPVTTKVIGVCTDQTMEESKLDEPGAVFEPIEYDEYEGFLDRWDQIE